MREAEGDAHHAVGLLAAVLLRSLQAAMSRTLAPAYGVVSYVAFQAVFLPSAIRGRERLCFGLKGMASGVTNESRRAGRFLTRLSPTSGNLWVLDCKLGERHPVSGEVGHREATLGREDRALAFHSGRIRDAALNPAGRRSAAGSVDGRTGIWDAVPISEGILTPRPPPRRK